MSATRTKRRRQVLRRIHARARDRRAGAAARDRRRYANAGRRSTRRSSTSCRCAPRDRDRAVEVLSRDEGVAPAVVPHVIPLLAWQPVADYALFALRKVAEERVGELTDALLDPDQDVAVRVGLARVFSVCVSQRAADSLMLALDDRRSTCGSRRRDRWRRSSRRTRVVADRLADARSSPRWCWRRSCDEPQSLSCRTCSRCCRWCCRASRCRSRFAACSRSDRQLRGTALEYLEGVLPPRIRRRPLWPFARAAAGQAPRRRHGVHDVQRSASSARQR